MHAYAPTKLVPELCIAEDDSPLGATWRSIYLELIANASILKDNILSSLFVAVQSQCLAQHVPAHRQLQHCPMYERFRE